MSASGCPPVRQARRREAARAWRSRAASWPGAAPASGTRPSRSAARGRRAAHAERDRAKIAAANSAQVVVARARHVEDAAQAPLAGSLEQVAAHRDDAVGDVERARRRAVLIRHDRDLVAVARQAQHRFDEILAERAVDPGGAQDDVVAQLPRATACSPASLVAPVDPERPDRIVLAVGAGHGAVEDVIGRDMDHRNARRRGIRAAIRPVRRVDGAKRIAARSRPDPPPCRRRR